MRIRVLSLLFAVASAAALTNTGWAQSQSMTAAAPNVGTGWIAGRAQTITQVATHTYTNGTTSNRTIQYSGFHSIGTSNYSTSASITQYTATGPGSAYHSNIGVGIVVQPGVTVEVKVTLTSSITVSSPGMVTVVGIAAADDGNSNAQEGSGSITTPVSPPPEEPGDEEEQN